MDVDEDVPRAQGGTFEGEASTAIGAGPGCALHSTDHAGLVLVRELFDRVGVADLIDAITVKKRQRG
jgi:hypothetical protein